MKLRLSRCIAALMAAGLMALPAAAAPPLDFQSQLVLAGLAQPIGLAFLPDGRMIVMQRTGELFIGDPGSTPTTVTPYLDISANVESSGERGLFGIAIDPAFAANGFLYLYYTHGPNARHRIARFTHSGSTANPASEFLVWEDSENWSGAGHIGGGLAFGPDGYLYLATGDENDGAQAQDLTRAGGKILRVAADGSIPADNPFLGVPSALPEIWAFGLRNPLRARWDLVDGRYFIGDVGQDTFEEIHEGRAGANFGWPVCEGICGSALYDDPLHIYPHTAIGGAVIAGFTYRGFAFPPPYPGSFFYADFVAGAIRNLGFDVFGNVVSDTDFEPVAGSVVDLAEGPDGALYYVEFSPLTGVGSVRRIAYQVGNHAPVISFVQAAPTSGPGPTLDVQFDATAIDDESDPLTYSWTFGDGGGAGGDSVLHTYTARGLYTVQLSVSDGNQTIAAQPIAIEVGGAPVPTITLPANGASFRAGDTILFAGSVFDPDEVLGPGSLSWDVRFNHDQHAHPELSLAGVASGSFTVPVSGHDFHDQTAYVIRLDAMDSDGLSASVEVELLPEKVGLVVTTSPPGMRITRDGTPRTAPHLYDTLVGFEHEIGVDDRQCLGGIEYQFASWSDAGAATHTIVTPDTNPSFTATFNPLGPCERTTVGQIALYTFEAGNGTTVVDRSGVAPALDLEILDPNAVQWLAGGGVSATASGRIQSSGNAVKINDAIAAANAFTFEAIVVPGTLFQFGPARIASISSGPSLSDAANLMVGQGASASEPTTFAVRARTTATTALGLPGVTSPVGSLRAERTHLVVTREASGLERIFVDGQQIASATVAGDLSAWTSLPLTLANTATGTRPFLGEFHLAAFYDRALTLEEVQSNFRAIELPNNAPTALPDTYETAVDGSLAVPAASGVLANDSDADDDPLIADLVTSTTGGALSLGPDGSVLYTADPGTVADSFTYRADDGLTASAEVSVIITVPPPPSSGQRVTDGLRALYTFAAETGDTVVDRSGVEPLLDLIVDDPARISWVLGGGMVINDVVTITHPTGDTKKIVEAAQASNEISVEVWVAQPDVSQFGPARIVALTIDPVRNGGNLVLGPGTSPTATDRYSARVRSTTTSQYGTPALLTALGTVTPAMTHVLFTRDALGNRRFWVDGVEVAADVHSGNLSTWRTDARLALANEPTGDRPWLGELQLVAFYDRALDEAEVAQNFVAGPRGADPMAPPPTSAGLVDPNASPSSDTTPVIRLAGVVSGDLVLAFSDALCTLQVGAAIAPGNTVDIGLGPLDPGTTYTFYAIVDPVSGERESLCTNTAITYEVLAPIPVLGEFALGLLAALLASATAFSLLRARQRGPQNH